MKTLLPYDLSPITKAYQFAGAQLLRLRYRYRGRRLDVELVLRVRPSIKKLDDVPKPVRVRLVLVGVDEMRFQRRPGSGSSRRIPDAHFGYYGNLFYVALDSWSLTRGERPGVFDFRAADLFFGCKEVQWDELAPRAK